MAGIELRLCDEDRARLGGPEWIPLDLGRLYDTESAALERWEAEAGESIEGAILDLNSGRPRAASTRLLVWLARKQGGDLVDAVDPDTGRPESYARLAGIRTLQVRARSARDVDPPEQTETTSESSGT